MDTHAICQFASIARLYPRDPKRLSDLNAGDPTLGLYDVAHKESNNLSRDIC